MRRRWRCKRTQGRKEWGGAVDRRGVAVQEDAGEEGVRGGITDRVRERETRGEDEGLQWGG